MRPPSDRAAIRLLLLAVILAVLGTVKVWFTLGTGPFGHDGAFYVNVARNVQEGVGLKTSISMYHAGDVELPMRSSLIYPLWPLLLGYTARLTGLFPAVDLLPKLLYFIDLLLFYRLANLLALRMNRAALVDAIVTPGHILVLLLGTNGFFFGITSQPYTDALGFAFAFATLLVLDRGVMRVSPLHAAVAGVLAGLAMLTRTQLVVLIAGIALALAWLVVCDRRLFRFGAAFAVTCGAMLAVWYFGFYSIEVAPRAGIAHEPMWMETRSTAEWLRHRVEGLVVSLSPGSSYSYFRSLGYAVLLPLIAAPVALATWLRATPRRFCPAPEALLPLATTISGIGFFFVLNLFHHRPGFFMAWIFAHRHALPVMLLIAAATVFLLGRGPALRIATLAVITITIALSVPSILSYVTAPRVVSPTPAESALVRWLDAQKPKPAILTARSQHLSVYTRSNLYWTLCETPPEKTREMLARLPIDYVVVYPWERRCAFVSGLGDVLVERARFGQGPGGIHVLGRRDRPRGR